MKLNTRNVKTKKGMTLLELTVVILVLLSLISVLFIGARAWKRGSDRAGCIINIRNTHQAVRAHQNMSNILPSTDVTVATIVGSGLYLETYPICPGAGTYSPAAGGTFAMEMPENTTAAALTCSLAAAPDLHVPASTAGW